MVVLDKIFPNPEVCSFVENVMGLFDWMIFSLVVDGWVAVCIDPNVGGWPLLVDVTDPNANEGAPVEVTEFFPKLILPAVDAV